MPFGHDSSGEWNHAARVSKNRQFYKMSPVIGSHLILMCSAHEVRPKVQTPYPGGSVQKLGDVVTVER